MDSKSKKTITIEVSDSNEWSFCINNFKELYLQSNTFFKANLSTNFSKDFLMNFINEFVPESHPRDLQLT